MTCLPFNFPIVLNVFCPIEYLQFSFISRSSGRISGIGMITIFEDSSMSINEMNKDSYFLCLIIFDQTLFMVLYLVFTHMTSGHIGVHEQ